MGVAGRKIPFIKSLAVVFMAGAVVACSPRVATRGNLPNPDRLSEIKIGDITKDEVAEIIGSPSSIATFGDETWFYISERTETLAWFEPKVIDRQVVVMQFDKQGVLKEMRSVGLDEAKKIEPVTRQTPTHGNEMTVLEQIVGNFQRFVK